MWREKVFLIDQLDSVCFLTYRAVNFFCPSVLVATRTLGKKIKNLSSFYPKNFKIDSWRFEIQKEMGNCSRLDGEDAKVDDFNLEMATKNISAGWG